jgi:3-hydroxyacyl-[acyl-carrier-protein] dehydratase
MTATDNPYRLNIDQIRKFLPHRSPFLLIDRVLEIHPTGDVADTSPNGRAGTRVVALKNVTYNEPCFQGHFPEFSILPGVLLVEIMAQAASFSTYPYLLKQAQQAGASIEEFARNFQCILVGVDSARFRRPVVPGDSLRVETTVTKCRGRLWAFQCVITVDGKTVAEADIMANLISSESAQAGAEGTPRP